jgi:hypothetical protein
VDYLKLDISAFKIVGVDLNATLTKTGELSVGVNWGFGLPGKAMTLSAGVINSNPFNSNNSVSEFVKGYAGSISASFGGGLGRAVSSNGQLATEFIFGLGWDKSGWNKGISGTPTGDPDSFSHTFPSIQTPLGWSTSDRADKLD